MAKIFNKRITLANGYSNLDTLLTAENFNGKRSLAQLRIVDLVGDTNVIFVDTPGQPAHTAGELVGAAGFSKQVVYDGSCAFIPATNVWLHQAAGHEIMISVITTE